MRLVALDFETYYDTEYSLSKMTTEAYLRDSRMEIICVTATINKGEVLEAWGYDAVKALLLSLELNRKDTITVAHNARFDASIIEWLFGIQVHFMICTIYMMRETGLSRLIGESLASLAKFLRGMGYDIPEKGHEVANAKGLRLADMTPEFRARYGGYCRKDTIILRAAAYILLPMCPQDALRTMSMTLQMYTRPVFVLNRPLLEDYLNTLRVRRQVALQELATQYGHPTVELFLKSLRSKPKFAALLTGLGVEPPLKESLKKTAKAREKDPNAAPVMDFAFAKTDLEFKELEDHPDPRVSAIVVARMENNTSQAESRTVSFLAAAINGTLPVPLQYGSAHTNRYGGDEKLNLQNLPKRNGDKTLRISMCAPEGYEVGGADSSQIEARLLAYAAQERDLLAIFESGGDPYAYMGEAIYREPADVIKRYAKMGYDHLKMLPAAHEDHGLHKKYFRIRNVGKETVLGSGYQMSGAKFALRLKQQGIMLRPDEQQIKLWARDLKLAGEWPATKEAQVIAFNTYLNAFHLSEAKRINRIYRTKHEKIKNFWMTCEWVLSQLCQGKQGYFGGPDGKLFYYDGQHKVFGHSAPGIRLPDGYWMVYPDLKTFTDEETGYVKFTYSRRKGNTMTEQYIYGGSLTENLIQALAFAVLKWQAVRIHAVVPVKMNVHDEWMSVYRIELREKVKQVYMTAMSAKPSWLPNVPLACEFTYGSNYGEC